MNPTVEQLTNNPNWALILSWEDIYCYLSRSELIKLSTVSKFLRNKLNPAIFGTLILRRYSLSDEVEMDSHSIDDGNEIHYDMDSNHIDGFNNSGQSSNISSDSIINRNIQQLIQDLYPYKHYLIDLSVQENFNHYYLLAITSSFPNLKYLSLSQIQVPLVQFHQILMDLNSLESLRLDCTQLIIWSNNSESNNQLILPSSLRLLEITNIKLITSRLPQDPMILDYNYNYNPINFEFFYLPPQYLPNLHHLIYIQPGHNTTSITNQFLSLNPHLKTFETVFMFFNQQTLNLLQSCYQLNNLTSRFNHVTPHNLDNLSFPTLNTLYFLSFNEIDTTSQPMIEKMSLSCPNLTHLSIGYELNYVQFLNSIIRKLTKLQSLSIGNQGGTNTIIDNRLELCTVKHLRLQWFNVSKIDLTKFEQFCHLKQVTFQYYDQDDCAKFQQNSSQFKAWRCFFNQDSIQCCKI